MKDKKSLRQEYKERRKELTAERIQKDSERIRAYLLDFLAEKPQIRNVHTFLSIEKLNEVNTFSLLDILWKQDYDLFTSILDPELDKMATVSLKPDATFVKDQFGIPIPEQIQEADFSKIQLILVPLLAWDKSGNRLGYGKGHYDKYLASLGDDIYRVGLSFFPAEPTLPFEPHDVRLTHVITPEGVIALGSEN